MPDFDPKAFVDIHVISEKIETIQKVQGQAYWLTESNVIERVVEKGDLLHRDSVLFLESAATVEFDRGRISGGQHGRTHSFVDAESIRDRPDRADVPRLLEDLESLKQKSGFDPLKKKFKLKTAFDRITARDFAFVNLDLTAARSVPEGTARELAALCLFFCGDTACVALKEVSLLKLHAVMTAFKRPIQPHLIDAETMDALFLKVHD